MKHCNYRFIFLSVALLVGLSGYAQLQVVSFKNPDSLRSYFRYRSGTAPIISGHRGSHISGYPENAIATFEYVLKYTPAFFEVDPRLTRDSVIVLLHDATLDRTTTGKGKLADYTWAEVKKLRLKDKDGNVTPYRIPTLEEAINWARGKTVLNLDKKDVPPVMIAGLIRRLKAGNFVMVTVHNAEQAKFYYKDDPDRFMSAFVKTEAALKEYETAGVPWANMITYIGSDDKPQNRELYDLLHARKVKCMISAAPLYDKLPSVQERAAAYRSIFSNGADILESDYAVEVATAIGINGSGKSKKAFR